MKMFQLEAFLDLFTLFSLSFVVTGFACERSYKGGIIVKSCHRWNSFCFVELKNLL